MQALQLSIWYDSFMKRLRLKRHHLKHLGSLLAVWLVGFIIIGSMSWPSPLAEAATFSCLGQSTTYTVDAPASVVSGKSLGLNDITEIGNSLGFTITSISATFVVTGAAPASFTKTWTGSGSGTFSANLGSQTLTATAAAGGSVEVKITSMTSHVQQLNQDFTCSVENGQMSANGPGQSLTLATVAVTAPPTSSGSSSTSTKKAASATTTSSAASETAPSATSNQSSTPAQESAPTSFSSDITFVDKQNQPLANVQVILDSKPPKRTDSHGRVHFDNLTAGKHNVTVISKGKQTAAVLDMVPSKALIYRLGTANPPKVLLISIWTGAVAVIFILFIAMLRLRRRLSRQNANNIV